MNSLQTPIRRTGGESTPGLGSPFRTPVRAQAAQAATAQAATPQAATPQAATPQAATPRGHWTNPSARQSTERLRWNVASLVVVAWAAQTGVYRQVKGAGAAAGIPAAVWALVEWAAVALLAYNVGEAVWRLLQPAGQRTHVAMTAGQRGQIRHRRAQTAEPGAEPDARRRTPVTDVDARRRTPGSGAARVLRSPGSARAADADLTLTQVLNKVPGAGGVTDAAQTTPTRLPARFGAGDAAATPQPHLRGQLALYHTATPARASLAADAGGAAKERPRGAADYLEPDEVLAHYGAAGAAAWAERMRAWFVRHLLRPLGAQMAELDALFEQHGLGHLACSRAELDPAALLGAFGGAGASMGGTNVLSHAPGSQAVPQTLEELARRYGALPQTRERMALERYLRVPGYACRAYVVRRVAALAQGGALAAYAYDGGGAGWSGAQHPTDAQLLLHLFCTFMDQAMPPVPGCRRAFSDRYVLQAGRAPDASLPAQIVQVARKKPHFCLVVKGAYYDVAAGPSNLFVALALFVLEIRRECAGYLGLTNLGGKQ
ncbi:hypothetical protein LPJ70_003245, partial [Coemansia sp. RSA 2708]